MRGRSVTQYGVLVFYLYFFLVENILFLIMLKILEKAKTLFLFGFIEYIDI